MKSRKLVPFIAILASITLSSCGLFSKFNNGLEELLKRQQREEETGGVNPNPYTPENKYKYTIMYYMCGSSLEYDKEMGLAEGDRRQGFMTDDIKEILSVNYGSDVKVIIQTGGVKHYATDLQSAWCAESTILDGKNEISDKKLQCWEVEPCADYKVNTMYASNVTMKNKLKFVKEMDTNLMATELSFEKFLKWGLENYSADHMGVIISGHGGGIAGCAYDDNYNNNTLNTAEIAEASNNALKSFLRDKFTFLGFDCCLMACADIASVLGEYYEYMVSSQETEEAEGWKQSQWLPNLVSNPDAETTTILKKIVDSYVGNSHTVCGYTEHGTNYPCYSTLSVLDLSKATNLVDAFEDYVDAVGESASYYTSAYRSSFAFGDGGYGLVDFVDFVDSMGLSGENTTALKTAINDLVIYKKNCTKYESEYSITPCGVNVFFPINLDREYSFSVDKADYIGNTTKFTTWQLICNRYTAGWR